MDLDSDLVKDLCCPRCKTPVSFRASSDPGTPGDGAFICEPCKLRYRVEDGIPNFLVKDAEPL